MKPQPRVMGLESALNENVFQTPGKFGERMEEPIEPADIELIHRVRYNETKKNR